MKPTIGIKRDLIEPTTPSSDLQGTIGQRSYSGRDGFRRDWQIGWRLPVLVSSAGNTGRLALSRRRSSLSLFLGCYRLNGSSLRSAPYDDLLHRIALSPSTTHRRWRRRGNVGLYVSKTERKRERKRERERRKRPLDQDRRRTFIRRGTERGKEPLSDESPRRVPSRRVA